MFAHFDFYVIPLAPVKLNSPVHLPAGREGWMEWSESERRHKELLVYEALRY